MPVQHYFPNRKKTGSFTRHGYLGAQRRFRVLGLGWRLTESQLQNGKGRIVLDHKTHKPHAIVPESVSKHVLEKEVAATQQELLWQLAKPSCEPEEFPMK